MQDFDLERRRRIAAPRTFKIAEQEFTRVSGARPETLLAWSELTGNDGADRPADGERAIELMDRLMRDLLVPESAARWAALRAVVDDPLTIQDINDVVQWVVLGVMGRPLASSVSSADGSETTPSATDSTPPSSSPATPEVSTASTTPDAS